MAFGILIGLVGATFQSLSYLASRLFTARHPGSALRLAVYSHLVMGGFSLVVLPLAWPATMPPVARFAPALLGNAFFTFFAQVCLVFTLKRVDPSRISPLLGLKIVILAAISTIFLRQHYTAVQWLAVGLSVAAAMMLNTSGGGLGLKGFWLVMLICLNYCLADISIQRLVHHFVYLGLMHASVLCAGFSYLVMAVLAAAVLPYVGRPAPGMGRGAVPFALAWFVGMFFIYGCFEGIGVVFGNIVQSSRGLISIALGALVAWAGWEHLERRVTRGVLMRRIAAAVLMSLAIALFHLKELRPSHWVKPAAKAAETEKAGAAAAGTSGTTGTTGTTAEQDPAERFFNRE